ncbi:gamma-tubulin complex component 3 homolog [Octopus sinensis]|uniref:Gamma-tubulin complex component 3 homolog n=1 Tax=Octopus sinensis TaxID=2607531 RepID=A0A6P7TBC7_9MOLL|nr:gamma-tubulin complex component 3 homolog [Octopus sinensis]
MSSHSDGGGRITLALQKLCRLVTSCSEDEILPYYQHAIKIISMHFDTPTNCNEFDIVEKIKRHLARNGKEKEAASFASSYRVFQNNNTVKQKGSVLVFLYRLKESNLLNNQPSTGQLFGQSLTSFYTSTPIMNDATHISHAIGDVSSTHSSFPKSASASSGFSSLPSPDTQFPPRLVNGHDPSVVKSKSFPTALQNQQKPASDSPRYNVCSRSKSAANITPDARIPVNKTDDMPYEISESELLKDLVYVFQGIEGKWIKFDPSSSAYRINPDIGIGRAVCHRVSKLAECGWLHNKIKEYVECHSQLKAVGLVEQSFCAALHQELTEYYRLMAVLESQLHQEKQGIVGEYGHLSLCRMVVWTTDPLIRLKALAALVDVCKNKRGGALASTIYSCMQHGEPYIKQMLQHLLNMVVHPIYVTLLRWIYDGDLENDPLGEFFVACNPKIGVDVWRSKYMLRTAMIPSFISTEQAEKILNAGKSIKFLHCVCNEQTPAKGQQAVQEINVKQAESMFTQNTNSSFQQMIDEVYVETSRRLLDCMHKNYKFMDHLKALRRYLLFGQGDFITHLMCLLETELAKPANTLYPHNLTGILEAAVRATNAQFDDSDILDRLDVKMMEVSSQDTGWDVFSLYYHVDGPIKTVFYDECVIMYLKAFNFLWRAKRMEHILATVWKGLLFNAKSYRQLPELKNPLHRCHVQCSKMVQFISQLQYYINFEVLECSWDKLVNEVKKSKDLNDIIKAHDLFLEEITTGCLLNKDSYKISEQLRSIFDLIIKFQVELEKMYKLINEEKLRRAEIESARKRKTNKGAWALTAAEEAHDAKMREMFQAKVHSCTTEFNVLGTTYESMVQRFLDLLGISKFNVDHKLQYLCYRLDFNEHYKTLGSMKGMYSQYINGIETY